MTLDEAIKYAEERAEDLRKEGIIKQNRNNTDESVLADRCIKCAEEHEQLAKWLKELKELREQTRWIPVSERLPEDGQNVLFCDIDNDIMVGYHIKGRPSTHFSQDGTYEDMKNIKMWMPLPKPYKEESEEE